jgi:Uma2 family endonuclease
MFLSHSRRDPAGDQVRGAPDVVIEVLSPHARIARTEEHVSWFARYGVRECWLVSLRERRYVVLTLDEHCVVRQSVHLPGERLASAVIPDSSHR